MVLSAYVQMACMSRFQLVLLPRVADVAHNALHRMSQPPALLFGRSCDVAPMVSGLLRRRLMNAEPIESLGVQVSAGFLEQLAAMGCVFLL